MKNRLFIFSPIYLSIYLSVVYAPLLAQPGEISFPNSLNCNGSDTLYFCLVHNGVPAFPADPNSVVTDGTADFGHEIPMYQDLGPIQKMFFWFVPESAGNISITYEADTIYTFQADLSFLQDYTQFSLTEIDFDITADCGGGTGVINTEALDGFQVTVQFASLADTSLSIVNFPIENLEHDSYVVIVNDFVCTATNQLFEFIEVPDGSFTVDANFTNKVEVCVDNEANATGIVPATIVGEMTGGSGDFQVSIDFENAVSTVDEFQFSISQITEGGTYNVTIIDQSFGCEVIEQIIIPQDELEFYLSFGQATGIVTNGSNTCWYHDDGYGKIGVLVSDDTYDISYDWSPAGGNDSIPGQYQELTEATIYNVTATIDGSTCSSEFSFNLSEGPCVFAGDLNCDGTVNVSDLNQLYAVFGVPCTETPCLGDLNDDGIVNATDLGLMLSIWWSQTLADFVQNNCE
jgi:hypothetical protein